MTGARIEQTSSAYGYPLLIKPLLESGVTPAPEQATIYADKKRLSYRELGERVGRLTLGARSALAGTGHGRFNADDVYMPITPIFHVHAWGLPYIATTLASLAGALCTRRAVATHPA